MNDFIAAKKFKAYEDLDCESAYELFVQAVVIVPDYQLIQVVTQELEDYADVFSKNYKIFYPYYIRLLLLIDFFDMAQDFYLNKGLL